MMKQRSSTIEITEASVANLAPILGSGGDRSALHLCIEPGGCSGLRYVINAYPLEPGSDQTVIESHGVSIVVATDELPMLSGSVIEYNAHGFSIQNPNARMACNCGASFALPIDRRKNDASSPADG
ncbi:MAG: iron-sulfur cluster assembly accessory protein [Pseudaminobacter sp.]